VFHTGRPSEAPDPPASGPYSCTVEAMVVSVGPYSWWNRVPGSRRKSSRTCSGASESPPVASHRRVVHRSSPGSARSACICEGGKTRALTPWRRTVSTR
jgi:hypothetical protein